MALSPIESAVLWGVPVLTILITLGYYFYWGMESEEGAAEPSQDPESMPDRGEV